MTNKAQLIEALSERLGDDKKVAAQAVDGLVDIIIRTVNKGEKVNITGFGVFEKRARAARTARNPRTGEAVKVKKTNVPAFRAGTTFKDVIGGSKKVPKATPVKRAPPARATATKTAAAPPPAKAATTTPTTPPAPPAHPAPHHPAPAPRGKAGRKAPRPQAAPEAPRGEDPRGQGHHREGHHREGHHHPAQGRRQAGCCRHEDRRGEEACRRQGSGQAHV